MIVLGKTRFHDSKNWVKRHSLSLALSGLLLTQTVIFTITSWRDWTSEQEAHGRPIELVGFIIYWIAEMMLSTLADSFGVLIGVLFYKWFYEEKPKKQKPSEG